MSSGLLSKDGVAGVLSTAPAGSLYYHPFCPPSNCSVQERSNAPHVRHPEAFPEKPERLTTKGVLQSQELKGELRIEKILQNVQ